MQKMPVSGQQVGARQALTELRVRSLSPEDGEWIIRNWWMREPGDVRAGKEPDEHWQWNSLIKAARASAFSEAVGAFDAVGRIEGGVLYDIDAVSILEPAEGACYVGWLASAPWNRLTPIGSGRSFSGVGRLLMSHVARHSELLGLDGRVVLASAPAALRFYQRLGFVHTGDEEEGLPLLELPVPAAKRLLGR